MNDVVRSFSIIIHLCSRFSRLLWTNLEKLTITENIVFVGKFGV